MRKLIKVDGTEVELAGKVTMSEVRRLIGAITLDSILLRDQVHIMIVDDTGVIDGRPRNNKATGLYHDKCGGPNGHFIAGDVVIVPDEDYA